MTQAIISFDTELSPALYQQGFSAQENFDSSILGICEDGEYGIVHQMDILEKYGLRAVFFVDPMPALVHGIDIICQIVAPIMARGHEIQLHLHPEWLEFAKEQPVGNQRGRSIGDFKLDAQIKLIALARDLLMKAGAPEPVAFRAGNFGANDDTIEALHKLGISYDSSFNAAYIDNGCNISLDPGNLGMRQYKGVWAVPVSGIMERESSFRPAQVCAMSEEEMRDALNHAASCGANQFSVFSHSFELLSRNRSFPNHLTVQRLEALCQNIAADKRVTTGGFMDLPDRVIPQKIEALEPDTLRTLRRRIEQGLSYAVYEARLLPTKLGKMLHR